MSSEPVAWQCRFKPNWRGQWSEWEKCSREVYEDTKRASVSGDWEYEARALYTHDARVLSEDVLIRALHISPKLSCDDRIAILREAQRIAGKARGEDGDLIQSQAADKARIEALEKALDELEAANNLVAQHTTRERYLTGLTADMCGALSKLDDARAAARKALKNPHA